MNRLKFALLVLLIQIEVSAIHAAPEGSRPVRTISRTAPRRPIVASTNATEEPERSSTHNASIGKHATRDSKVSDSNNTDSESAKRHNHLGGAEDFEDGNATSVDHQKKTTSPVKPSETKNSTGEHTSPLKQNISPTKPEKSASPPQPGGNPNCENEEEGHETDNNPNRGPGPSKPCKPKASNDGDKRGSSPVKPDHQKNATDAQEKSSKSNTSPTQPEKNVGPAPRPGGNPNCETDEEGHETDNNPNRGPGPSKPCKPKASNDGDKRRTTVNADSHKNATEEHSKPQSTSPTKPEKNAGPRPPIGNPNCENDEEGHETDNNPNRGPGPSKPCKPKVSNDGDKRSRSWVKDNDAKNATEEDSKPQNTSPTKPEQNHGLPPPGNSNCENEEEGHETDNNSNRGPGPSKPCKPNTSPVKHSGEKTNRTGEPDVSNKVETKTSLSPHAPIGPHKPGNGNTEEGHETDNKKGPKDPGPHN